MLRFAEIIVVSESDKVPCFHHRRGNIAAKAGCRRSGRDRSLREVCHGSVRLRLIIVMMGLATLAAGSFLPSPVHAQRCTADVQCRDGGRSRVECVGNTLVIRRSICAGTCRDIEELRQNCGNPVSGGRCSIASGTCEGGSASGAPPLGGDNLCALSCTCRRNVLVFYRPLPGIRCARHVMRCERGCSCRPQPHCL
jgi:hypothetical protein